MNGDVLVTGATGLIGGEVAWRVMRSGRRVWCIVRSNSFSEAAARIERRFAASGQGCDWSRLVALPGDVTQELLGLGAETLGHLRRKCRYVIHCAADTSFAARNRCAHVNLAGTRNMVDFCAATWPRVRLFHMSSAVTCLKSSRGIIHEDDVPDGFTNDYVDSKRKCERLVLEAPVDAVVLRPSIVLSHGVRSSGFARSILWVLPVMHRLGVVPLTGEEPIDIVSVRFVADCIVRMLELRLEERVYHISAGPGLSVTLKEAFQFLMQHGHDFSGVRFEPDADRPTDVQPDRVAARLRRCFEYYLPFLRAGVTYNRQRLDRELGPSLPAWPCTLDYCASLLDQFSEREAYIEGINP